MREILFRGKDTDTGEWRYSMTISKQWSDCNEILSYCIGEGCRTIVSKTLGQYTGLTDKNGKKIFEGDILKGEQYPYKDCGGYYNYFAEVVWFDNSPAFGIYTFKNPNSNVRGISMGNTDYFENFTSADWEIIGNIHDNPELLKRR